MIRITLSPAMTPASLVACLCASLKYAGTVTTAWVTGVPRYASAVSYKGNKIIHHLASIFSVPPTLPP